MTFKQWLFTDYPNPHIDGQWGLLHILTLAFCIGIIVGSWLIFRNKSNKAKRAVLFIIAAILLMFEITRRVVNFIKTDDYSFRNILSILAFRPMCAMMSFSVMFAVILNKKWYYNFASIGGFFATIIFFAYPGVGFNNEFILFENLYSIATHSLILILSFMFIVLKFTKFEIRTIWKTFICWIICVAWALFEKFVLHIEDDAMYFMPNNDVQEIINVSYEVFLAIYIIFTLIFINLYYFIDDRKKIFRKNSQIEHVDTITHNNNIKVNKSKNKKKMNNKSKNQGSKK